MDTAKEFDIKMGRLEEYAKKNKIDGLILSRVDNFAWATCGAASYVDTTAESGVAVLLWLEGRPTVITNDIEKARMIEEELPDLPVDVDCIPWAADRVSLIKDYISGKKVLSDTPLPNISLVDADFALMTSLLTDAEVARYRHLGSLTGRVIQKTCNELKPGMAETEIAGRLARNCWEFNLLPVVTLVAADDRLEKYRHPLPTQNKFEKVVMLVVCARSKGLIASCTRMVHVGEPPEDLQRKFGDCLLVDVILNTMTKPGARLDDVFLKAKEYYTRLGWPYEWEKHHQGGLTGYKTRYFLADEVSSHVVEANTAYAWNPSITGVKSEDTLLVLPERNEFLTQAPGWPTIELELGDFRIERPDILAI